MVLAELDHDPSQSDNTFTDLTLWMNETLEKNTDDHQWSEEEAAQFAEIFFNCFNQIPDINKRFEPTFYSPTLLSRFGTLRLQGLPIEYLVIKYEKSKSGKLCGESLTVSSMQDGYDNKISVAWRLNGEGNPQWELLEASRWAVRDAKTSLADSAQEIAGIAHNIVDPIISSKNGFDFKDHKVQLPRVGTEGY